MNRQKLDNALNLALQTSQDLREKSQTLETGYDSSTGRWRVIIRYTGDLDLIREAVPDASFQELLLQYGIASVTREEIMELAELPQIQFIEKPQQLSFNLSDGRSVSCVNSIQSSLGLTGRGVLVGIIDSGIDVRHPTFQTESGQTRILSYWDQQTGVYTQQEINQTLAGMSNGDRPIPGDRGTGHGTSVAGIAAGNGRGSVGERYRGIAPEAELVVVKLAQPADRGFPRTTEVMEGIAYCIRIAMESNRPIALNLSFGNNDGAHAGDSLFETFVSEAATLWKCALVIATGNEGDSRHHQMLQLSFDTEQVEFAIGPNESSMTLQIWKQYQDEIELFLEAPDGTRQYIPVTPGRATQLSFGDTSVLVYYGEPSPYSIRQGIYLEWIRPNAGTIQEGVWRLHVIPDVIRSGRMNLWLPNVETVGLSTGFLRPSTETTLTSPATARNIIATGAYQIEGDRLAPFSGRGPTEDGRIAPDLVAPGVGIMTSVPGGGYGARTGTSFAAPFVTGAAALLMEWGMIQGNDPYLYGEKIKAYLIKGANQLPGLANPNPLTGWGALCVRDSFPV